MHHEHASIKNSTLKVRYNSESNKVNIHLRTAYKNKIVIIDFRHFRY